MKPSRVILGTFLTMLATQTIGTIDDKHRLPAPKQFVAITVLWSILFLAAETTAREIAARLSMLILLTGMVLGPFGNVAINFLRTISSQFAPQVTNKFAMNPEGGGTGDTGATEIIIA